MEVNPLNIFFVKSDSKGDRLLFRYPFTTESKDESTQKKCGRQNPYAITSTTEDLLQNPQNQTSNISQGQLSGFTDEMLSTLFAVKAELCNRKFELKVNDVRFVGHPTLLPYRSSQGENAATILINIVFALQASASHSIVKCYYDLSKRLGKALRHEERRCSYLTEEVKIMLATHDEVSSLDTEINTGENDEDEENSRNSCSSTTLTVESLVDRTKSPFHLILQRSALATSMKQVFDQLTSCGIVQVRINKYVLLSFCLPHKAHQIHNKELLIEPETIDKCIHKLRPYHGLLLMVNPNDLLASIPLDGSSALLRLIKLYSPLKSLQTLAIEADLSLTEVFQLTGHLVYWAKATIIYPLCEGNVYVVAPGANIHINSPFVEEFAKEFPGLCLLQLLSEFSLPAPLWYVTRGVGAAGGARLARVVAWLLRRRLLLQLHTYVQFNAHWGCQPDGKEYYCDKHNVYDQSCDISFSSLNNIKLNVPEPLEPRAGSVNFLDMDEKYPTSNNLNQTDFSHTKPIVIESDFIKYEKFKLPQSFDEGIDVVDGPVKTNGHNGRDYDDKIENDLDNEPKKHGNSVDSGISNNGSTINGTATENRLNGIGIVNGHNGTEIENGHNETDDIENGHNETDVIENGHNEIDTITNRHNGTDVGNEDHKSKSEEQEQENEIIKKFKSGLSDNSLKSKLNGFHKEINSSNRDTNGTSDEEKSDCSSETSSKLRNGELNGDKNGITLNLELQSEMSFQPPSSCEGGILLRGMSEPLSAEALLSWFTSEERAALSAIPSSKNPHDLLLLAQLHRKGYFRGEQHLEEIMFMENVSRSQLMQLLDKFKDILITFETEDPAVAMLYPF